MRESVRVRLLLVSTPEVRGDEERYGLEATAFMRSLLAPGASVLLERDWEDMDHFGRLLRYVYLEDGRMVNELLVAGGYAQVMPFWPNRRYRYLRRLRQAER